jgi:hypothetical protein
MWLTKITAPTPRRPARSGQLVDFGIRSRSGCGVLRVPRSGTHSSRAFERIALIRLDLVAWAHGDKRRCYYHARVAQVRQLPIQRIPGWPSFVGDPQSTSRPNSRNMSLRTALGSLPLVLYLLGKPSSSAMATAIVARCASKPRNRGHRWRIMATVPTSMHLALRRTSFVRLRNLRYCVRRPFRID